MHSRHLFIITSALMLLLWIGGGACSKSYRRLQSATWHVFPLRQRISNGFGRSMDNPSVSTSSVAEGRGFMKKFMMFKSMFQQPESNIIIITQPPVTTPTTTPPTTATTTTAANTPTAAPARASTPTQRDRIDLFDNDNQNLDTSISKFNSENSEDLFQSILSNNNLLNHSPKSNRGSGNKSNANRRRRIQRQRNQNRKRLDEIVNSINRKPSPAANVIAVKGNNINGSNSNLGSIPTPGGLGLNANAQIQNIMNALRQQQTSVVYT